MKKLLLQDLQTRFDKELDDEDINDELNPQIAFYNMVDHMRANKQTENALLIDMPFDLGIDPQKKVNESTGKIDSIVWLFGEKVRQLSIQVQKIKLKFLRFFQPTKQDYHGNQSHKQKKEEKAFGKKTLDLKTLSQSFDTLQLNPFYNQTGRQLDVLDLGCLLLNRPLMNSELTVVIDPDQLMNVQEDAVMIHQGFIKLEDDLSPFDYDALKVPTERFNFRFIYEFRDRVDVLFPKRKQIQDKQWAIVENQINERQLPSWLQAQQSDTFQEFYQKHFIKKQEDFDHLPQLQGPRGQFVVKQQEPQDIPLEQQSGQFQIPQLESDRLLKISQQESERPSQIQKIEDDLEYRPIPQPQSIQNPQLPQPQSIQNPQLTNELQDQNIGQLDQLYNIDIPSNMQPPGDNNQELPEEMDAEQYQGNIHFEGYEQDYIDQMQENQLEEREAEIGNPIQNLKIDEVPSQNFQINQVKEQQLQQAEQHIENSILNQTYPQNSFNQQKQIPQIDQPIQKNVIDDNTLQNIRNQSLKDILQNLDKQFKHEQREVQQVAQVQQTVEQPNQLKHEQVNFQVQQQTQIDNKLKDKYSNYKQENKNRTSVSEQNQPNQYIDDYDQIESDFSEDEFRQQNYQKIEQVSIPKPKLQQKQQIQKFQFNSKEIYNRRELQQLPSTQFEIKRLLEYRHLEDKPLNIEYHRFFEFFMVNIGKCDELKEEVPLITEIQQLEDEDLMEIIQIENFPIQERIESQDDQFLEFNYYALPMRVVKKNSLPINMKQMQELIITMLKKIQGPVSFLKLYQSLPYIIDEHITKQKFFAALMFVCKTNISLGQIESNDFQFKSLLAN